VTEPGATRPVATSDRVPVGVTRQRSPGPNSRTYGPERDVDNGRKAGTETRSAAGPQRLSRHLLRLGRSWPTRRRSTRRQGLPLPRSEPSPHRGCCSSATGRPRASRSSRSPRCATGHCRPRQSRPSLPAGRGVRMDCCREEHSRPGSPPPRRRKRPHRFASCRLRAPARASRTSALARHMWAALWDRSPGRSRHACPLGRAELRRAAPSPRRPTARSPCKTESPSQRAPACRATSATPNLWVLRRPDRAASRSTEGFRRDSPLPLSQPADRTAPTQRVPC